MNTNIPEGTLTGRLCYEKIKCFYNVSQSIYVNNIFFLNVLLHPKLYKKYNKKYIYF